METSIPEQKKAKDKTAKDKQTYFRVAFKNNCNLLQIADNKANIVITINSAAISSTVALLGYGSVTHQIQLQSLGKISPILLFLGMIIASTMLSVQAAKPSIISREKSSSLGAKSSLLFFGESSKYSIEDYLTETQQILGDRASIRDQMAILSKQGTEQQAPTHPSSL